MDNKTKIILRCENIKKYFRAIKAVDNCTLEFSEGTITSIIGPNGSGKTTLFNLITGFLPLDSGKIYYLGKDITELCKKCKSHVLAKMGIAQSFQLARGFGEMTILETLMVPPTLANDNSFTSMIKLLVPGIKEKSLLLREKMADEMLLELGLKEKRDAKLQDQDVGTQKLVELGQIFLLNPTIFLLDEPLAGVSENKEPLLLDHLIKSKKSGKTIIMISHKLESVLNVSDFIYVMMNGVLLASGSPQEIRNSKKVKDAYLGG